ncbi:MAG TPA: hypothetical protein PKE27_23025 [Povalibacter sp.]|uniref:hypothetical protein n=1 Tax=Povalibacter sp. TaxID=1962978 RepID=UPI002C02C138|nr:hypothetical protein [Povalibacter sp.]HMN47465.1 hypothetical protein [Povalibacter sp.]
MDKLIEFLQRILDWFVELLLWVPRKLWELLLDGLATVIEAIPAPGFMANLESWVSGLDPAIAYFGGPLQLGTGMTFVAVAYVLRFAIRRLPVVG